MSVIALPDQAWIDRLGPVPGADLVAWDLTGQPPRGDEIELIAPPYRMHSEGLDRLAELPRLRHVQLFTAGFEHAVPFVPAGASLANAAGVHDAATAELAVTLALAAQRSIPEFVLAQGRGEWVSLGFRSGLADKRVLIVGYGRIGQAIAGRLAPFEVQLTAVATTSRGSWRATVLGPGPREKAMTALNWTVDQRFPHVDGPRRAAPNCSVCTSLPGHLPRSASISATARRLLWRHRCLRLRGGTTGRDDRGHEAGYIGDSVGLQTESGRGLQQ